MTIASLEDLESRLHEPLPVHERVRLLNEISEQLHEREPARGAALAREAIQLARATGDSPGEAQALYCLGRNLQSLADYPAVFETQNDALALFRSMGNAQGEARCCNLLGITHRQLSDYGRALEMYEMALKGFRESGDLKWQARVVSNIGAVEIQLGNHTAALELFDHALELRRETADNEGAGFDLNNAAFGHIQRALSARRRLDAASQETERYKRLAMEDALTGLANRRQLDERLATLMREANTRGTVVTVALADIDHFKGINDRFSHAVGDEVLRCVGEILRAHCRLGDLAGRYGGEEFMLVFRHLEMRSSLENCERVRRAVEIYDWKSIHPQLHVTLSMGLASSTSFEHPQGLLDAAEHWLYESKHHGRNQVQPLVVAPA